MYVSTDDIPADIFEAEKAIEMQREDLLSKPEEIRAKIAEGRVKKMLQVRRAPLFGRESMPLAVSRASATSEIASV